MSQQGSQLSADQITDLEEELETQKVILLSLDDTVEDRDDAELQVKQEIVRLQKRLRAAKSGSAPLSRSSSSLNKLNTKKTIPKEEENMDSSFHGISSM